MNPTVQLRKLRFRDLMEVDELPAMMQKAFDSPLVMEVYKKSLDCYAQDHDLADPEIVAAYNSVWETIYEDRRMDPGTAAALTVAGLCIGLFMAGKEIGKTLKSLMRDDKARDQDLANGIISPIDLEQAFAMLPSLVVQEDYKVLVRLASQSAESLSKSTTNHLGRLADKVAASYLKDREMGLVLIVVAVCTVCFLSGVVSGLLQD